MYLLNAVYEWINIIVVKINNKHLNKCIMLKNDN